MHSQTRVLRKILVWLIFPFAALVLASVLGGSALWQMIQAPSWLTIDGQAKVVYPAGIDSATSSWQVYGGDAAGQRFSKAHQITAKNVSALAVAWQYQSGDLRSRKKALQQSAFEVTPILVEKSLVFCTPFNEVIALDPGTGKERWRFDAGIALDQHPANQYICRGVAYWRDRAADPDRPCASRLFMGTNDARVIALDARSGNTCSDFGVQGQVQIKPELALRWPGEFQITSAPVIADDVVVVGSAISDNLRVHAPSGVVRAFDVRSGHPRWQFDPVPDAPSDPASATWLDATPPVAGQANVWAPMSVDENRGLIFLPTSSPSPDFYGGLRAGADSYSDSVVALRAATGKVVWHYQTVHHDIWDYDLPAQPGVYSVWRKDGLHDVIAQVTKTGLVFVLDRETGKPFLPVAERAVPQQGAAAEWLSATQPFPLNPPPIVPHTISPDDAFGITYWDRKYCARRIERARSEGLFTPPSTQGTLVYPFTGGGANWGGAAFDPRRNLLLINMSNAVHLVTLIPAKDVAQAQQLNHTSEISPMEGAPFGMKRELLVSPLGLPCNPPPWGVLAAVDLANGDIVWRKVLGTTEDLAPGGLALKFGTPNFGGPIVTAGDLVFIGATMDNYLRAFDVASGDELWKGRLPAGGQATPMTYLWQGRQYLVIAAGGHSTAGTQRGDYIVAFALPSV